MARGFGARETTRVGTTALSRDEFPKPEYFDYKQDKLLNDLSEKIDKSDLKQMTDKMMSLMSESLPNEIIGNKGPMLPEDRQAAADGIAKNILALELIGKSIQSELGKIDGLAESERKELGEMMMLNEVRRVMLNAPDIIHAHLGRGFEEDFRPFGSTMPTRGANPDETFNKNRPWLGTTHEAYRIVAESLAQAGKDGRISDGVVGLIKRFVRNIDGEQSKIDYEGKPNRDTWGRNLEYQKTKYDEIGERTGVKYLPHQSPLIIQGILGEAVVRAAKFPLEELPTTKEGALKKLAYYREQDERAEKYNKRNADASVRNRDATRKARFERKKREEEYRKKKEEEGPDYPGKYGESLD